MALLRLNTQTMNLELQVGVLEEYKPDREIKNIHKKLEAIKEDAHKKLVQLTSDDLTMEQMKEQLAKDKETEDEWKKYLGSEFSEELKKLVRRINKKNEKICPDFKSKPE